MSEVVIFTIVRDDHACLVDAALLALGANSKLVCQTSIPGGSDFSITGSADAPSVSMCGVHFLTNEVTAFWNRRRAASFVMPPQTHPADKEHIEQNSVDAVEGVAVLLDGCFAVNRLSAARVTSHKLNQLRLSRSCGLTPPATLVSNDLEEIVRFGQQVGVVCMKPLSVYTWVAGSVEARSLTTIIDAPHLLDAASVALMPAIYQAYIAKAYEVRLTLFGSVVVGTRINFAEGIPAQTDWRADESYLARLEPITPPDDIVQGCRRLLARLDLRFGTFDFVVTPGGDWVFLEVNESGQFIWQEQFCPEQHVIEPFARFLMAADPRFEWDEYKCSEGLGFASLAKEIASSARYRPIRSGAVPADVRHWVDENAALEGSLQMAQRSTVHAELTA